MTREEYQDKIEQIDKEYDYECNLFHRKELAEEYISSLEADNERLTKALKKAAKRIVKEQICPGGNAFYMPECDNNCRKCWLDWLMNDNNQNKGDRDEQHPQNPQ